VLNFLGVNIIANTCKRIFSLPFLEQNEHRALLRGNMRSELLNSFYSSSADYFVSKYFLGSSNSFLLLLSKSLSLRVFFKGNFRRDLFLVFLAAISKIIMFCKIWLTEGSTLSTTSGRSRSYARNLNEGRMAIRLLLTKEGVYRLQNDPSVNSWASGECLARSWLWKRMPSDKRCE